MSLKPWDAGHQPSDSPGSGRSKVTSLSASPEPPVKVSGLGLDAAMGLRAEATVLRPAVHRLEPETEVTSDPKVPQF